MPNYAAAEAARELRAKIATYIEKHPDETPSNLAEVFNVHKSTIHQHLRVIAAATPDTIPKEKRMATTKPTGGRDPELVEAERKLDWHEQREKELLELTSILAGRLVKQMERVEDLEAQLAAKDG